MAVATVWAGASDAGTLSVGCVVTIFAVSEGDFSWGLAAGVPGWTSKDGTGRGLLTTEYCDEPANDGDVGSSFEVEVEVVRAGEDDQEDEGAPDTLTASSDFGSADDEAD